MHKPGRPRTVWSVGWVLWLGLSQTQADAVTLLDTQPAEEVVSYVTTTWKASQGLPSDWIECILQTRDGYLWLGTPKGLIRFDGTRFFLFNRENCPAFQSEVCKALAEDVEDNLWVGTKKGLLRFGKAGVQRFTATNGLGGEEISSLCASRAGGVWIGTSKGVSLYRNGRLTHYPATALPSPFIYAITEDSHGQVWVGGENGCYRFEPRGNRYTPVWHTAYPPPEQEGGIVRCILEDSAGVLWFGTDHGVFKLQHGELTEMRLGRTGPEHRVKTLLPDREGRLWAVIGGVLHRLIGDNFKAVDGRFGLTDAVVNCVYQDRGGNFWVGSRYGGLTRAKLPPFRVFTQKDGLSHNGVRSVSASRQGGVWVATAEGAGRFGLGGFERLFPEAEWGREGLTCILEDQGGDVWVGATEKGLFYVPAYDGRHEWKEVPSFNPACRVVWSDRQTNLWAGFSTGIAEAPLHPNLLRLDGPDRRLKGHRPPAWSLARSSVTVSDGDLESWIRTAPVWRLLGDRAFRRFFPDDLSALGKAWLNDVAPTNEPANFDIRALAEDRDGNLWLGTAGGGLQQLRHRRFASLTAKDGLSSDSVAALWADSEGVLWAGTAGGLSRIKNGRAVSLARVTGPLADSISSLVEDDLGHLWLNTEACVCCYSRMELNEVAEGRLQRIQFVALDDTDGLLSTAPNGGGQPAACKTADGMLWFATTHGLIEIDPHRVGPPSPSPINGVRREQVPVPSVPERVQATVPSIPLHIEEVRAGSFVATDANRWIPPQRPARVRGAGDLTAEAATLPDERSVGEQLDNVGNGQANSSTLRLPPGSGRHLEIHYAALDLGAPERMHYAYQLEGDDASWVDAGPRPVAFYTNLRPGHYRFRVKATDRHGRQNTTMASLALYLAPHIYETVWFRVGGSFMGATLLCGMGYWRLRDLRRRNELEQRAALAQERLRIARDIHDDLGARLHEIGLLTELADRDPQKPRPEAGRLERIAGAARDLGFSLGEIVWALNPTNDTLRSLLSHLRQYAAEYLDLAGIRAELDWPANVPNLSVSAKTRHHLFLVVKEALHNSVEHAAATHIAVRLRVEDSVLHLELQDNGRGFDPEAVRESGNGLANMAHRITELGGRFELSSQPGKETRIEIALTLNG